MDILALAKCNNNSNKNVRKMAALGEIKQSRLSSGD